MAVVDDMADALAADTIKAMDKLGQPFLYEEVARELAAASTTMEEAFLTAMRVRLAERRGRVFLNKRVRQLLAATKDVQKDPPE